MFVNEDSIHASPSLSELPKPLRDASNPLKEGYRNLIKSLLFRHLKNT